MVDLLVADLTRVSFMEVQAASKLFNFFLIHHIFLFFFVVILYFDFVAGHLRLILLQQGYSRPDVTSLRVLRLIDAFVSWIRDRLLTTHDSRIIHPWLHIGRIYASAAVAGQSRLVPRCHLGSLSGLVWHDGCGAGLLLPALLLEKLRL